MRGSRFGWAVALSMVLAPGLASGLLQGKPPLPEPLGYMSDHAGVVEADWKARVRSVCQDLERKTGVEMVVVTVNAVAPYSTAKDYAEALYQRWGIGTAQQDHGILLLAVVEKRQATVTLGRNMIAVIPPPVLSKIASQYLDPAFRTGRYGEGLYRITVALASAAQDIRVGSPPRYHVKGLGLWLTIISFTGALAFLWWVSRPDLCHPFRRIHKGEFWGSGQGGFRGNFGGFGGGMGGEGLK